MSAPSGLPALQMLPSVVEAAGELPVLFDSGVRSGSDVVTALAMGATAVGTGRPYVYALAAGGADGVVHHLRSFLAAGRPAGHKRCRVRPDSPDPIFGLSGLVKLRPTRPAAERKRERGRRRSG